MASTLTIKAYLSRPGRPDEIRRFAVDEGVSTSYDYLSRKVGQVYQGLSNISLSWKDAEGDLIVFSSDDELMEALGFVTDAVFRIYIRKNGDDSKSTTDGTVHPRIICDGCEQPVIGVRYKCLVCPDYDLCGTCEGHGTHADHHMIKMRKPEACGWTPPGCPGFGGPPFGGPPRHIRNMIRQFWSQMAAQKNESGEECKGCQKKDGQGDCGESTEEKKVGNEKKQEGSEGASSKKERCGKAEGNTPDDYLKAVGEQVATMLEPFGIDTEVEVEHEGSRRRCGGGGPHGPWNHGGRGGEAGGQGPWWARWFQQQPWSQDMSAFQTEAPDSEKPATEAAKPPSDTNMSTSPPASTSGPGATVTGDSAPAARSPGSPNDPEWTLLNKDKDSMDVERSGSPPEGSQQQAPSSSVYPSLPPQPSNSRVQQAVDHLKSMGFSDDGGWLTQLAESREGDINKVLDALRPHNAQ